MHSTRARRVIKLIEYPKKFKKMKVERIEIGTVINGIIVLLRFLRNKRIISVTSKTAKQSVNITSFKASETNKEVS